MYKSNFIRYQNHFQFTSQDIAERRAVTSTIHVSLLQLKDFWSISINTSYWLNFYDYKWILIHQTFMPVLRFQIGFLALTPTNFEPELYKLLSLCNLCNCTWCKYIPQLKIQQSWYNKTDVAFKFNQAPLLIIRHNFIQVRQNFRFHNFKNWNMLMIYFLQDEH